MILRMVSFLNLQDLEAMEILARYHANGGHIKDPLVVFEWTREA